MFGHRKPPNTNVVKQNSVDPGNHGSSKPNPFDSDSESDDKNALKYSARRTSSEPELSTLNSAFIDDEGSGASSVNYAARNHYKNDFRDSGGLESQSVQELENYAVYKAEENTKAVNGCLRIAENIREDATKTLVTLHQQGEQITRTHNSAANIEQDLSRGEKLLGSLGGMFSKTWKPKKTRGISGPVLSKDDSFKRRGNHMEQREKLGLTPAPKVRSNPRQSASEPTTALQKVEVEKAKQDDGLDDLSNILGDLKVMAVDMGSEIEREWRQSGGLQPGSQSTSQPVRDPLPSPTFSASRKRQKTSQLVPSLSLPPQTSFPSIQAANRGSLPVLGSKKPISQPLVNAPSKSTQYPCTISSRRGQLANRVSSGALVENETADLAAYDPSLIDVPLHMAGGGSSCDASGKLPPRKSKKLNTNHQGYKGDESAKKVQATQQLTTHEILKHDGLQKIPSSTRASTSLEAAVSQYGLDIELEKTSVNKENALPKRAYDKLSCSTLPTQATESTTPKSLNSKLFSSITAIRNFKRRDFEGNKTFLKDYMGVPNSEPMLPFLMHKQINQGQIRHQHLSHPNSLNSSQKMFQSVVDLDFSHIALTTIRDRLREWRYKVKKTYYEPYATDEERIANRHSRIEEGQWIRLLALWSTEAKMIESKRNKS